MSTDAQQNKFNVRVFCVTVLLLVTADTFINYKNKNEALDLRFNGRIDSVNYNQKSKASIFIKGVKYDLFYQKWDFDHNRIQTGDSIIKKKGSIQIKLIRPDGNSLIEGGDN